MPNKGSFVEYFPKSKRTLRDLICAIGRDPFAWSEARDRDETGRQLQIAISGDHALTYWIDDADRHVKILDIHPADR